MSPKKPHKKTFAQIMAEQTPKVADNPTVIDKEPKVEADIEANINNEMDNQPFRWCFIEDEMRWNSNFSFKEYKRDLRKFLSDIEIPLHEKYHDKTWGQVNKTEHCGKYSNTLNEKQKEIACTPHKPNDENLYHVHISQKHVIFGYRLNNVFHLTINDPDHEFNKL